MFGIPFTIVALIFVLAFTAAPIKPWSSVTASLSSETKPSLTKYHNERLNQDRRS